MTAFSLATAAGAQSEKVSFCFNRWQPYTEIRDGRATGITVDILTEAADRAGLTISFQELPWNRCLNLVRRGVLDAVADAASREEFVQGPTSISAFSNTLWVRQDSEVAELDFNQLTGMTMGLVSGYEFPQRLWDDIEKAQIEVDFSVDDETTIRKLARGRVDIIVADFANTTVVAREMNLRIRALTPHHSFDRLYPSFNPSQTGKQERMNRALEQMLQDGFVDEIYDKYLGMTFRDLNLN